ncbi:MAG: alanine acetyltransferase [Bacteroidetes bacterium]|jgi:ribosomal-protein-alanine N-acetyltransferase|nr:alanine acetyltransferase [Bacteroidota bacterium]
MLQFNFTPYPALSTQRFLLKRIEKTDVNEVFAIRSDEEVMKFIHRPIAKTIDDAMMVVDKISTGIDNNESINWGIYPKDSKKLIGIIGYVRMNKENHRAEVGYVLHGDHHRKGIMSEVLAEVLNYGFYSMKLNTIEAIIDPRNQPSANLCEKHGFLREGYIKEYICHNEKFYDALVYSLLTPLKTK